MSRSFACMFWVASSFVCLLAGDAIAMMIMDYKGTTTVTVDVAPIREMYPDGRIVDTVQKGTDVEVTKLVNDGRGTWLVVHYKKGKKDVHGYINAEDVSFLEDVQSGRLK